MNDNVVAPTEADSALTEMREFAKKKQDAIVSATKIKILNRLLTDTRELIKQEESVPYLDLLSEEELPQNSDAVLILGQHRAALDSFESRHTKVIRYDKTWITREWLEENEKEEYTDDGEDENDDKYENGKGN